MIKRKGLLETAQSNGQFPYLSKSNRFGRALLGQVQELEDPETFNRALQRAEYDDRANEQYHSQKQAGRVFPLSKGFKITVEDIDTSVEKAFCRKCGYPTGVTDKQLRTVNVWCKSCGDVVSYESAIYKSLTGVPTTVPQNRHEEDAPRIAGGQPVFGEESTQQRYGGGSMWNANYPKREEQLPASLANPIVTATSTVNEESRLREEAERSDTYNPAYSGAYVGQTPVKQSGPYSGRPSGAQGYHEEGTDEASRRREAGKRRWQPSIQAKANHERMHKLIAEGRSPLLKSYDPNGDNVLENELWHRMGLKHNTKACRSCDRREKFSPSSLDDPHALVKTPKVVQTGPR